MVWARTKLLIWDYIFEPVKEIKISYVGRHPERLYQKINELIRTVFNVPDAYIQEKDYTWENIKGTERFDVLWEVTKILDMFSYIVVEIDLRGTSAEGEGRSFVRIRPRLITEYPQDTVWQQNIIYEMFRRFWHRMFYHHKRMEFLAMGKEIMINFERDIKTFSDTLKTT